MAVNLAPEALGLGSPDAASGRWLSVALLDALEPLSGSTARQDLQPIAERFGTLLFDDRSTGTPRRRTYAILDAAVCPHLPEMLESLTRKPIRTDGSARDAL